MKSLSCWRLYVYFNEFSHIVHVGFYKVNFFCCTDHDIQCICNSWRLSGWPIRGSHAARCLDLPTFPIILGTQCSNGWHIEDQAGWVLVLVRIIFFFSGYYDICIVYLVKSLCPEPPFTQVSIWVPANLMPRVTLQGTSISSRGK